MEYFKLTVAKLLDNGVLGRRLPAGNSLQYRCRHLLADVELPAQYPANRPDYIIAAFVFHDVTASACAQYALGVKRLVVHRDHEYGQIRLHHAQVFDEFKATFSWQQIRRREPRQREKKLARMRSGER